MFSVLKYRWFDEILNNNLINFHLYSFQIINIWRRKSHGPTRAERSARCVPLEQSTDTELRQGHTNKFVFYKKSLALWALACNRSARIQWDLKRKIIGLSF